MMNVLFIADNWFDDTGGRRKNVEAILSRFCDEWNISFLEVRTKEMQTERQITIDEISVHSVFVQKTGAYPVHIVQCVRKMLKHKSFDLVVCVGAGPHSNALFALAARLTNKSVPVVTFDQSNPSSILVHQTIFIRFITKLAYRFVQLSIAPSHGVVKEMRSVLGLSAVRSVCIPAAYSEELMFLKNNSVSESFFQTPCKVITTVCRLDLQQKDVLTLLDAFRLVLEKEPFARLCIIGEGRDRKIIEHAINRLHLSNFVCLLGFQKNPYKFMAQSDVFVLSSLHEGMGLVLVEAMACGTPVVSTDCNYGPRELIQDEVNGLLVIPGDPRQMSEALLRVLQDKELANCLSENGLLFAKKFSIQEIEFSYRQALAPILKRKTQP